MKAYRWLAPVLAVATLSGCATVAGMQQDFSSLVRLLEGGKGQKDLDDMLSKIEK